MTYRDDKEALKEKVGELQSQLDSAQQERDRAQARVRTLEDAGARMERLDELARDLERTKREIEELRSAHAGPRSRSRWPWRVGMGLAGVVAAGGVLAWWIHPAHEHETEWEASPPPPPRPMTTATPEPEVEVVTSWAADVVSVDGPAGVKPGAACTLHATLNRTLETSPWRVGDNALAKRLVLRCGDVDVFQRAAGVAQLLEVVEAPGETVGTYRHHLKTWEADFRVDTRAEGVLIDEPRGVRVVFRFRGELGPSVSGPPVLRRTVDEKRRFGATQRRKGKVVAVESHELAVGARCEVEVRPVWAGSSQGRAWNARLDVSCGDMGEWSDVECPSESPLRCSFSQFSGSTNREEATVDFKAGTVTFKATTSKGSRSIQVALDPG